MHALITGGSGFFAGFLADALLARGWSVRNLDLVPGTRTDRRLAYVRGSVVDPHAVAEAVRGVDVVFHAVASQPLGTTRREVLQFNPRATEAILGAARRSGVAKLVFLSSTAIYGIPRELPIRESTSPRPAEAYGRSKVHCERLCAEAAARGLDLTIVRPRTIIGPGRLGIFQLLFEWVRRGSRIPVFGDGSHRFQFVHAKDLAEACLLAAERQGSSEYNVGADRFGSIAETLQSLIAHARSGSQLLHMPRWVAIQLNRSLAWTGLSPLGAYHYLAYGYENHFDVSKARTELGWKPCYSNDEMLREAYDWYLLHRRMPHLEGASPNQSAVRPRALALLAWLFRE